MTDIAMGQRAPQQEPRPITFIGPLPPPVTGMTAMTSVIVRALDEKTSLRCYGWTSGKPSLGVGWKLVRARGYAASVMKLLFGPRRKQEIVYFPANSEWGLCYDLAVALVARLRGYRIAVHHHAYSYLHRYDRRMALLNRLVGRAGAHVVHCETMQHDFTSRYTSQATFLCVPPTIVSHQLPATRRRERTRPIALGCLSNLSIAKGLPIVLDTFEHLRSKQHDVRLILAGPCIGLEAQKLVETAQARWSDHVDYRGPVYEDDKAKFYRDVDVFLFPTQYRNESWGIVLTEAMSTGCPVITYDRGCVSHIVRGGCGKVVDRSADFVTAAAGLIEQWIRDQASYRAACVHALERNRQLEREAEEQLPRFVERLQSLGQRVADPSAR